jgi:hypothetical protein
MSTYIPKQPKQNRDRVEAKLDRELIRTLERYCQYLDSDRDYIIGKALEIAFKKDKAFTQWLESQPADAPAGLGDFKGGNGERKTA